MSENFFDFRDAGEQRSIDLIPAHTICAVQLSIRPGGAGDDGWLKLSRDGASEALDCEFTVVEGDYAKRKIWALYTVRGTTPGHAEAAEISRKSLCAVLESARGVRPDDKSEAAQKARQASGWSDFDGLRLIVRVGVRPPEGAYAAKNTILEMVTPEKQAWRKIEQIQQTLPGAGKPRVSGNSPGAAAAASPATPPANAVSRPQWAR